MTNPELYPVTTGLTRELDGVEHPLKGELINLVGAYEHGEADPQDVIYSVLNTDNLTALKVYAAVVEDIVRSLAEIQS